MTEKRNRHENAIQKRKDKLADKEEEEEELVAKRELEESSQVNH